MVLTVLTSGSNNIQALSGLQVEKILEIIIVKDNIPEDCGSHQHWEIKSGQTL